MATCDFDASHFPPEQIWYDLRREIEEKRKARTLKKLPGETITVRLPPICRAEFPEDLNICLPEDQMFCPCCDTVLTFTLRDGKTQIGECASCRAVVTEHGYHSEEPRLEVERNER